MKIGETHHISTKIDFIDMIAKKIAKPLKKEEAEISLFGDSPLEETQRPDIDMLEDDEQIRRMLGNRRGFIEAESINEEIPENFKSVVNEKNDDENFYLEYFIDGSIRTKYIGEILIESFGGPMVASNVGAIASKVDYIRRVVIPFASKSDLALYFPGSLPDSLKSNLKQIENEIKELNIEFLEVGESESTLRSSAGGKARSRMHEVEIYVAENELPAQRGWLAIDGALRKSEFYSLPKTIGIAKSFSAKVFFLGNDGRAPRTISHLAKLKRGERTTIYKYKSINSEDEEGIDAEKLVFWYLRLRESPPEMAPLGGIVKIDIGINKDKEEKDLSNIADKISYSVMKVMNPSIFPRPRWPSFVYPVRVSEEYLASLLFTEMEFNRLGVILRSVIM